MELALKNPELVQLDKEMFELNKFYSLAIKSLDRFPNIYAVEEFSKKADMIKNKLASIQSDDEFDAIFIDNSLCNIASQKIYLNYYSKGDITVDEMSGIVLGEEALQILKSNIENFDYKAFWDFYVSHIEYSHKLIPCDDEETRGKLKKILVSLKEDFLVYIKEEYGIPQDYDFDLVLGQPYSSSTFFHPTNRRMEISPDSFLVFKDAGEVKINVSLVVELLFHEILGHGRHEILSREMPATLQSNSINTSLPSLHVHFEGVSQIAEKEGFTFMQKFKDKYNIEEDYIQQRLLSTEAKKTSSFSAFYKYLGLRKIEDASFDQDGEFRQITNNHGLSILYKAQFASSLVFSSDAVYPVGLRYMENYLSTLKETIGEEAFEEHHVEINKAIATGVFNFKVLPKFIDFYLKKKGILEVKND